MTLTLLRCQKQFCICAQMMKTFANDNDFEKIFKIIPKSPKRREGQSSTKDYFAEKVRYEKERPIEFSKL